MPKDLTDLVAASFTAFEIIRLVARGCEDQIPELLAASSSSSSHPRRPPAQAGPIATLCEGISATAERLRDATVSFDTAASSSPAANSVSWHRHARYAAITTRLARSFSPPSPPASAKSAPTQLSSPPPPRPKSLKKPPRHHTGGVPPTEHAADQPIADTDCTCQRTRTVCDSTSTPHLDRHCILGILSIKADRIVKWGRWVRSDST